MFFFAFFIEDLHVYVGEFVNKAMTFMQGGKLGIVCGVAFALYFISWILSVNIYERKEF